MIDPEQTAVATSRGGKPKDQLPTDLEIAFRAQNGSIADIAEIEQFLTSVLAQLGEAEAQVTEGANATVRRISRIVGEAMSTAKTAKAHVAAVKANTEASTGLLRQAAIYDAQRAASWTAMEDEIRKANESDATHREVAVNAIAAAQRSKQVAKRSVIWSVFTTCIAVACVIVTVAL